MAEKNNVEVLEERELKNGKYLQDDQINFEPRSYEGIKGEIFDYIESGKKWIQQTAAEGLLGVRVKQFDRYCSGMKNDHDYEIEKIRRKPPTKNHSYNFVKEEDVIKIAEQFNKKLRWPINDLKSLDPNKPTMSQTDVEKMGKEIVENSGLKVIEEFKERVNYLEKRTQDLEGRNLNLELSNDDLNSEVNKLVTEKADLKIKKNSTEKDLEGLQKSTKGTKIIWGSIAAFVILSAGTYGYFNYQNSEKKEEKVSKLQIKIEEKNVNLQEVKKEILKTQGELSTITEINKSQSEKISDLKDKIKKMEYDKLVNENYSLINK